MPNSLAALPYMPGSFTQARAAKSAAGGTFDLQQSL
jgi:hypothetical protein